jgi:hypothetical protein
MELDLGHPELLTDPIHLLAIHIEKQYSKIDNPSTTDTFLLPDYVFCGYFFNGRAYLLRDCCAEHSAQSLRSHDAIYG